MNILSQVLRNNPTRNLKKMSQYCSEHVFLSNIVEITSSNKTNKNISQPIYILKTWLGECINDWLGWCKESSGRVTSWYIFHVQPASCMPSLPLKVGEELPAWSRCQCMHLRQIYKLIAYDKRSYKVTTLATLRLFSQQLTSIHWCVANATKRYRKDAQQNTSPLRKQNVRTEVIQTRSIWWHKTNNKICICEMNTILRWTVPWNACRFLFLNMLQLSPNDQKK